MITNQNLDQINRTSYFVHHAFGGVSNGPEDAKIKELLRQAAEKTAEAWKLARKSTGR